MTLNDCIQAVRDIKQENIPDSLILYWLSVVDGKVALEILKDNTFVPYTADTDKTKELLVPFPYTDIYIRYCQAMIDERNNELNDFNNDILLFNNEYNEYANYYCRTHSSPDYTINYQG